MTYCMYLKGWTMKTYCGILLGLLLTGPVLASDFQRGFYVGAGLGQAELELEDADSNADFKGDDTGFRIFGGYRAFRYFAVEAQYADFGDAEDSFLGVPLQGSFEAFSLSAVGVIPLGSFDLFGKLGFGAWEGTYSARGFSGSSSDDNVDPVVGLGLQYRMGRLAIRGEFESQLLGYDDDLDDDADGDDSVFLASLALIWRF